MFNRAERHADHWRVFNAWGHALHLPSPATLAGRTIRIGTLGTRFELPKSAGTKFGVMARMLRSLQRPLLLIDTRRSGVGASGTWGPPHFGSLLADELAGTPYSFIHLPALAPSVQLLVDSRGGKLAGWRGFAQRYHEGLGTDALNVAQAFVEAAAAGDGVAVLLCAEGLVAAFDGLSASDQEACHCHRFGLAARVADSLHRDHPGADVRRLDLDAGAFAVAEAAGTAYEPGDRTL